VGLLFRLQSREPRPSFKNLGITARIHAHGASVAFIDIEPDRGLLNLFTMTKMGRIRERDICNSGAR
jgi:hypothetical protein